ncbi:hypothetical protein SAMN05192574_103531 [Mucilaginibacter gossypiicola]|uniref:Uncharacterized protein n=1 Tax=Mucilaginibacter gossypiicola TaxID=551995 RepID=A0A1H8HJL1_9SPHI|nr:hypothetical protein SAMN05192574_103531 [Mucilaginibacter gossypiicola]
MIYVNIHAKVAGLLRQKALLIKMQKQIAGKPFLGFFDT